MAATIIRSGALLSDMLGRLLTETGIKAGLARQGLSEKDAQDATAAALSVDAGEESGPKDQADAPEVGPSKTMDADAEELKTGEVSFDNIVGKLNAIRSGRSFRDDDIKHAMEAYVKSLKKPERVALLAFLKGIAQIVTGEVPGQQAVDPADPDPAVAMKKQGVTQDAGHSGTSQSQRRTIKPNVITKKNGTASGTAASKGAEDASPPVPVPIKPRRK
jgi:hypothetical protein